MIRTDKRIVSKWSPVVENNLLVKNKYICSLCCHYMEYFSIIDNGNLLQEKIILLKSNLDGFCFKKQIKAEYINMFTGEKEYLLDDGTIFTGIQFCEFSIDDLLKIFGVEFITHMDKEISRDIKINKILD